MNIKNLHLSNIFFIGFIHIAAILTVFFYHQISYASWAFALLLLVLSNFGITAGAHRLWSHKSYQASPLLKYGLLFLSTLAHQGSIFHWVRDHRLHHKFSEKPEDPHNASRGFWFSHCGWLLLKKNRHVISEGKKISLSDITSDSVLMLQHRYYEWIAPFVCYVLPTCLAGFLWNDYLGGFLVAACLRHVCSLHSTWLVNSAAHLWGTRPYNSKINPAENSLVNFLALGEGAHNFHHNWAFDYRASESGWVFGRNLTTALLDTCFFLKLASSPVKVSQNKIDSAKENRCES